MMLSQENNIDAILRAAHIQSSYDRPESLITGTFLQIVAVGLAYWDTGASVYLILMGLIGVWGGVRLNISSRFETIQPDLTQKKLADHWERLQLFTLLISTVFLGIFGFFGLYGAPSQFSELVSAIMIFGAGTSVVAKYYGSQSFITFAILALMGPFAISMLMTGDIKHVLLASLLVPFIFMSNGLATSLRKTLFSSARGRLQITQIADRFDTALNNMPQGLLMIDSDGRIEVANRGMAVMFGFQRNARLEGRLLPTLFDLAMRQGLIKSGKDAERTTKAILELTKQANTVPIQLNLDDGRALQISGRPRPKGGAVMVIENVTERVEAERKISQMARYDHLTQLPNRAYFHDQATALLEKNSGSKTMHALYVLDVDAFKSINDGYGHYAGDQLLKQVSKKLSNLQSRRILVSRLGGDEFTLLVTKLETDAEANDFAKMLNTLLCDEYDLETVKHHAVISIGYTCRPAEDNDFQTLMIQADLALYERKLDRTKPYIQYSEDMMRAQTERMQLRTDLGMAIRKGDLHVVYQPVISVDSNKLISAEALVRWIHPQLGFISPGTFVPLAEQMCLVSELTHFVLKTACAECAKWPSDISISVNLSAMDFDNDAIVGRVKAVLDETGLDAARLELEITETAAIKNPESVSALLHQLRALGCKIALDDFGVGYSGLSHLHALPLDRMKVDRSFTLSLRGDERKFKLLCGILALAQTLELETTVEGIEDYETLEQVLSAGTVGHIQGFVFGAHFNGQQLKELGGRHYPMSKHEQTNQNRLVSVN